MTQQQLGFADSIAPQYLVYVYHYPDDVEEGRTDWEKKIVSGSVHQALKQAQTFFDSRYYKKVEVKKRYFDRKYQCVLDTTYKVLQDRKQASKSDGLFVLLGLSVVVGVTVFALPFFTVWH